MTLVSINIVHTELQENLPFFWPWPPSLFADVIYGWSLGQNRPGGAYEFEKIWVGGLIDVRFETIGKYVIMCLSTSLLRM